jgi:hypothetical protein
MVRSMFGRRCVRGFSVSCLLRVVVMVCVWGVAQDRIRAEALPYAPNVSLGRPIHPIRLSFEGTAALTLISAGRRHALPAQSASEVTLEVAAIASDAAVAVVRVKAANGHWIGLLGGRSGGELLLFERADPSGDPGERRTREVAIRDGSVHTGIGYEGVTACGGRAAWLEPKVIDPATLTLVHDSQPTPPSAFEDAVVSLVTEQPVSPVLPALTAHASSELDGPTQMPRVPRALVDGELGRGLGAQPGALYALRWNNGALPIERLEVSLRSTAKPVELWWLGESARGLRAVLPAGSGVRRVAIKPPTPLAGRCLTLVVAQGDGLELRELAAYSTLDQAGGLERAISMMVQDDGNAGPLADVIEQLGPRAAEPLAARWAELSARGKRRSLKVLARSLDREPVRAAVLDSARSDDAELQGAAMATLERGGEPGRAALRTLAASAGTAGDRAVATLAARTEELPVLLGALAVEGGSERVSLRKAIELAARKDPARADAAAKAWLASAPSVAAQVSLALAVSAAGNAALAAQLAEPTLETVQGFADRYRLAHALAFATPSAASDVWLAQQAEGATEWMQRSAAFDALVRRGSPTVPQLADKLSHDRYPRVRAATLVPLLMAGQRNLVDVLLVQDGWPMVRAAAAIALARTPNNRAALERALGDDSARVRRAAVEALTIAESALSWPAVERRALAGSEALDVREAAVSFARALCVGTARPALRTLAARLQAPDASEAETELGLEALRVLHDLGGEAALEGAQVVAKGAPELATMWARLPAARCVGTPAVTPGT